MKTHTGGDSLLQEVEVHDYQTQAVIWKVGCCCCRSSGSGTLDLDVDSGTYLSFGSGSGSGFGRGATWMLLRAVFFCLPGHTTSVCVCGRAVVPALLLPEPANRNSSSHLHGSGMEGPPSSPSAPSWASVPRKEEFRSVLHLAGLVTCFAKASLLKAPLLHDFIVEKKPL